MEEEDKEKNKIDEIKEDKAFNKLQDIQILIRKESSLKGLCKKK